MPLEGDTPGRVWIARRPLAHVEEVASVEKLASLRELDPAGVAGEEAALGEDSEIGGVALVHHSRDVRLLPLDHEGPLVRTLARDDTEILLPARTRQIEPVAVVSRPDGNAMDRRRLLLPGEVHVPRGDERVPPEPDHRAGEPSPQARSQDQHGEERQVPEAPPTTAALRLFVVVAFEGWSWLGGCGGGAHGLIRTPRQASAPQLESALVE